MPGKMTKSILRPPFRPPQVLAAVRSSRLSCRKVGKAQIFTSARESSGESRLRQWSDQFFAKNGSAELHALLVNMTQTIRRTFRHVARHEKGVQEPVRTIAVGSGSCRDLAMLMIAALRSRGIAARFVSGYVHLAERDEGIDHLVTGGNTHAWVQVYVPGPGWVDFDPSAGVVGSHNLIRVAAVQHPRDAIPLQGTWYGSASDHLAMQVAVRVKAVDGTFARSYS